eukprot:429425-Rhodomonas_salina.2
MFANLYVIVLKRKYAVQDSSLHSNLYGGDGADPGTAAGTANAYRHYRCLHCQYTLYKDKY